MKVFYNPKTNTIIDFVKPDGRTLVYNRTQQEIEEREGPVLVLDEEEAYERSQRSHIHPPLEISKEYFWEMLEVLPPCRWIRRESEESFHVSELISGNIGSIFVRIGKRYFELHDDVSLTHAERVMRCHKLYENTSSYMPQTVEPSESMKLLTVQGLQTGLSYGYNVIPTCTMYWEPNQWVRFIDRCGYWYVIEEH